MHKSHKLLATWAAAAVVVTSASAASGAFGAGQNNLLTQAAVILTGTKTAAAQQYDVRTSFVDARVNTGAEETSALDKFRQQRSAALGEPLEEPSPESTPSSMSLSSGILIALLAIALGFIGFLIKKLPPGTLPSLAGLKQRTSAGSVSGRVAAARLVGRSDDDLADDALDGVQEQLTEELQVTAETAAQHSPRVQRVVMPTAEAVNRSLVPPAIRRPGNMATAAASALRQQNQNRDAGGTSVKSDDLSVQRRALGDRADRMFRELQRYYGFGSRSQLQGLLTPELFSEIEGGLASQDGSGIPQVLGLVNEVVSLEDAGDHYVGVVAYQATLKFAGMPPERSNELFRFVKAKGGKGAQYWKLAHIEQLPIEPEAMAA